VLNDEQFSFPVGRVEFLYMRPMSFIEFLEALGEQQTVALIKSISLHNPIDEKNHLDLLRLVRSYFLIGGMPEVVKTYTETKTYSTCTLVLDRQIAAFQQDFGKYAKKANPAHLKALFQKIPELVGHHFKYSKIDPHASNPARDYKLALKQLELAGLVHQVYDTQANGIPLQSEVNEKKFKPFFLDIGLLQRALLVDEQSVYTRSLLDFYQGALAEQFVCQELVAYADPHSNQKLYFWENTTHGSSAEIDFVLHLRQHIVPLEVKSGITGRLRSLKQFMEKKSIQLGVRISEMPLQLNKTILNVPFYLLSELPQLVQEAEILSTPALSI
jgi:predicted AAA+ superfamily ATPase